MTPPK